MTRWRAPLVTVFACLVVGAAGWASRAVLDEVMAGGVRHRIALVPSWQPFLAFAALGATIVAGLAALGRRTRTTARPPLHQTVLPAFALGLLVVPYLPGLPDWWPSLQVLAGPGVWMVWALVAILLVWVVWPQLTRWTAWWTRRSLAVQTVAIGLATFLAAGAAASRLTHTVLFPSGDEPHYLILAQSLWRDGDLKIEDNHRRREYSEYFPRDLDPHYLTRGKDGEIYSVHPIGMPVLMAPVYAAGGYDLVVLAYLVMASVAAATMWRWVVLTTAAAGTATLAWAAIALSAPFLINAFTIYPEIPAGFVMALAVPLALAVSGPPRPWHDVAIGALAATLPWLSTKYAPMSAALVAVTMARRLWPLQGPPAGVLASWVRLCTPYAVSLLGWFAFFYAYWGTPMPSAPYGAMVQTRLFFTVFGVPGLLFDQEYGLLIYAPAYLLAGAGFLTMARRPGPLRRLSLELAVIGLALLGTVGAFRIWWGGSAAPGRPVTSGLLLVMLPLAVQLGTAGAGSARRAAQHLAIWTGLLIAGVMVVAQDGMLIANGRDGTSTLLEWLSPRWPLWQVAPTFVEHEAGPAWLEVLAWLAAVTVGVRLLGRVRTATRGAAALAACGAAVLTLGAGATAMRWLPPTTPALPDIDLNARARLAALDSFDTVTRPYAVRYAPWAVSGAGAMLPALTLEAAAGSARGPQPLRVLHNGRFSLPAGRYRVVVRWAGRDPLPAGRAAVLALQVGRTGDPLHRYQVQPSPGGTWTGEFRLPVDAGFVGLRGTPEVERSIEAIRIEPMEVVDQGARVATPQVLAAAEYHGHIVLFHDENTYPEPTGFWTTGRRISTVTIACPDGCADGVVLRVHSGPVPGRLHVATHGHDEDVTLEAARPWTSPCRRRSRAASSS
ncbi:MAG: hypothetical protein R2708_09075 [Vicinamibacterales bacterium]